MKIAITGASGNLGRNVLELLIERKHEITCLLTTSARSKQLYKRFQKKVHFIKGDIRDQDIILNLVENNQIILHLAAIVPPQFKYKTLTNSQEVNVETVRRLVKTIEDSSNKPKLFFPSSVAVWGDVRKRGTCILTLDDEPNPNIDDIYAQQKVIAEELVRNSRIIWSIFRFGFIVNTSNLKFNPMMFDVPLDTNMEIIHVKDAALAIANGLENESIWNNILLVAGGKGCRMTYQEFIEKMFAIMGLGKLPTAAFGNNDFHCGFIATINSQELLQYQNYTFDDILEEMKKKAKLLRFFAILFKPIARAYLLSKSPYYKKNKKKES